MTVTEAGADAPPWYIVTRDDEGQLRVVSTNGKPTDWRRLTNVFRGAQRDSAMTVIEQCFDTASVSASAGGIAAPIEGPTSAVAGVIYSPQAAAIVPPNVAAWEWRERHELPPTLHLTPDASDLIGISHQHRDRSVYGPSDFWTRTYSVSDVIAQMSFTFDAQTGARRVADTVIRHDTGELRLVHLAEVVSGTGSDRVTRVIGWQGESSQQAILARNVDMELVSIISEVTQQGSALIDTRFPSVPIVCKWITKYRSDIGNGASNGQTSGWHPDDLPRVWQYLQSLATLPLDEPVPTLSGIRIRRAGGGWLEGEGQAFRLVPEIHPSVWLVFARLTRAIDPEQTEAVRPA